MQSVSIIIPTRNEALNISKLLNEIMIIMKDKNYEIIVVDDSDDETAAIASILAVEVINGQRKGLGQAIIDGIKAAKKDTVLVMDADGSHNPSSIPELLYPLSHGYDMSIGSRYIKNGKSVGWALKRRIVSRGACLLALPITLVKDATSGFFAFRKEIIKDVKLEASSWKIMLEILLKARPTRICEVPITFKVREFGKSKFNIKQTIAYLKHLILLAFWKYQKFIKFCIVGGTGALETFGITWLLTERFGLWYMASMVFAVAFATISNFTLNTVWTYRLGKSPKDADYEWLAFYKGNIIQKWWKNSIAKTVWSWTDSHVSTLDIGCGSSPIITHYNSNSMGIDGNTEKLKFMIEKCPNVYFSATELWKINNKYQQVLCIEVIEHLSKPQDMVSELARVTKSGGKVIIATPDYSKLLWNLAEKFTPYKEEHITKFTRQSLEKLCRKYNLVPIKYKYVAGCDLVEMFEKA